ncbi:helix-turn-helix domain-containing protein [Nostoc sp. MG11]|uniref:helix-turn-helix domain-containing protein n=1 Tax=Nostoc sp. MG11 TaxID=2721166 RepID=UPI001D035B87|nr:AraC family transcriptional regulator [Nostoc sp. MG11]
MPILVICDTKILEADDYNILIALSLKAGVEILPFNSLIAKATRDKNSINSFMVKKLLRVILAILRSQDNLKQEGIAKIQQNLEIPPDEPVKPVVAKSIFPSIPQLNDIFNFIETHYHQPIGLYDVAQSLGYSAAYLTDLVRRQTGQSVHRWITERRMVAACSLLLETDQSIDYIALAVGYRYTWCFFRHFRKSFGTTLGDWRSANRSSVAKTSRD